MNTEITILALTSASIGFVHTILGPDHYLPFIVMSRTEKWSMHKTALITFLCGLGHVMSSAVIGIIGIVFGISIMRLELLESFRGNLAAWLLIGFGAAYFVWGIFRAMKNKPHSHLHVHENQASHLHDHSHGGEHVHVHGDNTGNMTPWILFTIFVFGPCEFLIPILMYPAAKNSISGILLVTAIFGTTTIITMVGIVMASAWGTSFIRLGRTERYSHALAGALICISGLTIQFLGL